MSVGPFWHTWVRGRRWSWRNERFRDLLPHDLDASVMAIETSDRFHTKQGRSTARVRFDSDRGSVSVYLKRHFRLPWLAGVAAALDRDGRHSPAKAEWVNLERVRSLGVPAPEAVAVGESIGPWGRLQSYLLVAELEGCEPLHEAIPTLARALDPAAFAALKRRLIAEMAEMTARLHAAALFHKDLYLCHFFLDPNLPETSGPRLALIDFHRLREHRWSAPRWRWKDLGQLWFSTVGVDGIDDRDRLRFWRLYRRRVRLAWPGLERGMIAWKARRYLEHNR